MSNLRNFLEYFKTKSNSSEIENNDINSDKNDVNYLTNYGEKKQQESSYCHGRRFWSC